MSIYDGPEAGVVFSPDGRNLVYVVYQDDTSRLYRRPLNEAEATPIQGTEGATRPFFSPDGQWLGFRNNGVLKKVRSIGGVAVELGGWAGTEEGVSWGPDGDIVVSGFGRPGLWVMRDAPDAAPELLIGPDPDAGESYYRWPHFLPGGEALLFTIVRSDRMIDDSQIAVVSLETGEKTIVHDEGFSPRYSPTGHMLYGLSDTIRAVPFDLERLQVIHSSPTVVVDGVATTDRGDAKFTVSPEGVLAYMPGPGLYVGGEMVWVDRTGNVEPLPFEAPLGGGHPRVSHDGRRWAGDMPTEGTFDVWAFDLELGTRQRVTTEPPCNVSALWTPADDALVFSRCPAFSGGLFRKSAEGTGPAELLLLPNGNARLPFAWSADGATLVYEEADPETGVDIWLLPMELPDGAADEGQRMPRALIRAPGNQKNPAISHNGRWIAYESDESGQSEIYVDRFPELGDRTTISVGGGDEPLWASGGDEVFYRRGDAVIAVPVLETDPQFEHGRPVELFSGAFGHTSGFPRHWDVHPDGRFLMRERATVTELRVVTEWFEELKRLVPVN